MEAIRNSMRQEAQRAAGNMGLSRVGIIDGYDPAHYSVKVRIQPENTLTGWLPLTTPWVGNGWGMYAPPSLGDIVDVHYQQGSTDAGFVQQRFFSNTVQPLAVPSGEFWLVHKSGSFFKLHNDGSVEVNTSGNFNITANAVNITAPNVNLTGNVLANGDITDNHNTINESMGAMRSRYNIHTHGGIMGGSSNTNVPNQLM